uniref:Expp1 protein n=1 Tax=Davidia involucrata TaxID=16924 RepID=A0A5B6YWS7_DAVIN
MGTARMMKYMMAVMMMMNVDALDTNPVMHVDPLDKNPVFDPCSDTKIQRWDGFSFGVVLSSKEFFFFNQTQLSPCDRRLPLSGNNAQLAVFRPTVDEMALLTINSTASNTNMHSGYMVAFAGRQYAARSVPAFISDNTNTVISFTLVLEFQKGTLQNLYWKKLGCTFCHKEAVVCLNNQECAVPTSQCKSHGGQVDCSPAIQLTFSGTDKNDNVLNSWYEVARFNQNSLNIF